MGQMTMVCLRMFVYVRFDAIGCPKCELCYLIKKVDESFEIARLEWCVCVWIRIEQQVYYISKEE